eukprot:TRINITY_DN2840_c0_g1_i1.p1 TRINITY_DN2840_c0_g1~~TRINITY_DN2840_c0_g1_i1.p1  ORF type:complete len:187 (-),score=43.66 TRINITY_DN2840_c0_g1_i1:317-877(-)
MSEHCVVTSAADVSDDFKAVAGEWAVWDSETHDYDEPVADRKFHFDYSNNHEERVLIIGGKATLTPDDGSSVVTLTAGDQVSFLRGFKCTWCILEPMTKHYAFFDESGNQVQSNSIACDECAADCWEESWYVEDPEQDICPSCFDAASDEQYQGAVLQREGETVPEQPKRKAAAKAKSKPRKKSKA